MHCRTEATVVPVPEVVLAVEELEEIDLCKQDWRK